MPKVFISYRQEDAAGYAQAVYGQLERHLGRNQIFMDVDTVDPGADFATRIEDAIGESEVVIALIGNRWMGVRDNGPPRIQDPKDFVHGEIATALAREIIVIPVLVDGATLPTMDELPQSLQPLLRRQVLELRNTRFRFDLEQILQAVQIAAGSTSKRKRYAGDRRLWTSYWGVLVAVIMLGIAVGLWFTGGQRIQTVMENVAQLAPATKEPPVEKILLVERAERQSDKQLIGPAGRAKETDKALPPTTPAEDNAISHYRKVLKLDPNNRDAHLGLKRIGEQYAAWADEALDLHQFERAAENLEKAASAITDHPAHADLRRRLALRRRETQIKSLLALGKAAEKKLTPPEEIKRLDGGLEEIRQENARITAENERQKKEKENLEAQLQKFQAELRRLSSDDRVSDKAKRERIESLKKQIKSNLEIMLTQ
jgi:tetratricopeptide (TPR) repeat protein